MQGSVTRAAGRRSRIVVGLIAAALIAAAIVWGGARRSPAPAASSRPDDRVPLLETRPLTLAPGVHILGGLNPSAVYVVETSEGPVLIDSGLDAQARLVRAQMAELGLDWRRIRAILLTHAHGDHTGGAEYLRHETGARVYAGRGDADVLRAGGPREAFFSTFYMPDEDPHPTTVDVALEGDETIAVGDVRIRALATPGHTPGSICYLLEEGGRRVLFAGDVISMLLGDKKPRTKVRKPLGTYSTYLPPRYRGDARTYLASLRALRALPVPDLVLPGHPGADPTPQSPHLGQARWEALLDEGIRDMEALLARYERDGADFLDGEPKSLLPGLDYLGDVRGEAVYALASGSGLVLINAPGGPGLADFVESRLRRLGREPTAPTAILLTSGEVSGAGGLRELIEKSHAQVIAPADAVSRVAEACPAGTIVRPAEDLPKRGWFQATPTSLRGRGSPQMAYLVPWAEKTVLFSGRIPIRSNHDAVTGLFEDFSKLKSDPAAMRTLVLDYLGSLMQLGKLRPDLWLPAVPVDGQNANLYEDEWAQIVADNWLLLETNLGRRR